MDETYGKWTSPDEATILTGLLVNTAAYPRFRDRYYALLNSLFPTSPNVVRPPTAVHAMNLFPGTAISDQTRIDFLDSLVTLLSEIDARIYRVGYRNSLRMTATFGKPLHVLGLCFHGILASLSHELRTSTIWPVMETDNSPLQDQQFAGAIQLIDHYTALLPQGVVTVDNKNLGELLYTTKKSAFGAAVDCVAYLRLAADRAKSGETLSVYKSSLNDIAKRLEPIVSLDDIIEMQFS